MLATVVAIVVVDRGGRRMLFFEGGVQMALAEICMAGLIAWNFRAGAGTLTSGVRSRRMAHGAHAGGNRSEIKVRRSPSLTRWRRHAHFPSIHPPASLSSERSRPVGLAWSSTYAQSTYSMACTSHAACSEAIVQLCMQRMCFRAG